MVAIPRSFRPSFKASSRSFQMPPASPPMLDNVLSQASQRDLSSTQLFRSNSEYFDRVKANFFTENLPASPFDNKNAFQKSVFAGQQFTHNQQNKLSQLVHSQSRLFIDDDDDDDYEYKDGEFQDSPELFSQVMEMEHATKFRGTVKKRFFRSV